MHTILDRARQPGDPWKRLAAYITDLRDLQDREPAAVDVHLMAYPDPAQVTAQRNAGRAAGIALVEPWPGGCQRKRAESAIRRSRRVQ